MPVPEVVGGPRREVLARVAMGLAALGTPFAAPVGVAAKDYGSRREALDELDRLGAACGMRLGAVRVARSGAEVLVSRFLAALARHQAVREEVRRGFGLPRGVDPASRLGEARADLLGLRQSLDDLMIAYAESLPVFGDAEVVSRLAIDMVDVSRLRTVIDLWVEAEAA